jgi:general nucleoside transport system ATP-binding protein
VRSTTGAEPLVGEAAAVHAVADARSTALDAPPILAAKGIVKRFGDLVAVDHADLELRRGIHALVGENGAGKSTLVKAIYGYHRIDEGRILVDGEAVDIRTPARARRLGIGLVFQNFTLIPALTVTENVALFLRDLHAVIDYEEIARRIRTTSERYGLAVDPAPRVGTLSLPERQRVEILRVLLAGARILILDEPTSALPAQEIEALFAVLRRLRDDDYPVLLITHKLSEVFAVADRVTVMRRGAVVATEAIGDVTEESCLRMMFSGVPDKAMRSQTRPRPEQGPALALEQVASVGQGRPLFDLDLTIARGEVVGVAGIAGNGQRELADTVVGAFRVKQGRRLLFGRDATSWSVRRIRESGVAFVPENALGEALIWSMTLEENVALGSPRRFWRLAGLSFDRRAARDEWTGSFAELDLHLPDPKTKAGTLSGGNAQRIALARELGRDPKLLVALYPTRGLDVPTATTVQRLLLRARDRGCGILLVSQDLNELREFSDRLVVMREGRIAAEVDRNSDVYEIGRLMIGGAES